MDCTCKPVHSFLIWDLILDNYDQKAKTENLKVHDLSYTVYDRNSVPEDFLLGHQEEIKNLIHRLESECITQDTVNNLYQDFVDMMKGEMNAKLKYKSKPVQAGLNNKK